jgi:hypothetical protein
MSILLTCQIPIELLEELISAIFERALGLRLS